ncbi:AraC family transcriptional regulator [Paenibacillus agricola]|uniref:AraC family transcriptional regulator n=1 Tax=Paenibacillus agricola TaxID=2716264 RepID=A0ABX0IYF2_9BACL|nr:AraC family transcriptional regulator [Paenibacillus agricola]NHN29002.1 AraC family transcriptional regulator [Paenibacillus agricola]
MIEIDSVFAEDVGPDWRKPESVTESHIFMYIAGGHLTYRLNHLNIPLTQGDILYIPKGTLRAGMGDGSSSHQKYAVLFSAEETDMGQSPIQMLGGKHYQLLHARNYEYMKQRFSLLIQQWLGKLPHYEVICKGIMLELLGITAREAETADFPSKKLGMVMAIQQYILESYQGQIRLETLSQLVDRTPNYVTRIFREVTGQTPIDYLHQVRVYAARDLMLNSSLTIGQVADILGYCDQSYFNRMYKKITGHPPSSLVAHQPVHTPLHQPAHEPINLQQPTHTLVHQPAHQAGGEGRQFPR